MPESGTVVIVEDDLIIAEQLRQLCEDLAMSVLGVAPQADEADRLLREVRPEYVLMDVRLGGLRDGVDVAQDLHRDMPGTKVVFVTGSNEPAAVRRIREDHPYRVLVKPIGLEDLRRAFA